MTWTVNYTYYNNLKLNREYSLELSNNFLERERERERERIGSLYLIYRTRAKDNKKQSLTQYFFFSISEKTAKFSQLFYDIRNTYDLDTKSYISPHVSHTHDLRSIAIEELNKDFYNPYSDHRLLNAMYFNIINQCLIKFKLR